MDEDREEDKRILDIDFWEYEDKTVGASFTACPDGQMWAEDEETLQSGILWLTLQIKEAEKEAQQQNSPTRKMDIGMQGQWIDDRFTIRFLPLPGFGVSFSCQETMKEWLTHLISIMAVPQKITLND